ncbi:Lsr2 family protein [Actinomycetes bacterium KLBMP 9759]
MATQTTVTLVDDLDGSVADGQVDFSIDGRSYAIDLSAANSERLREIFAPFVAAARRTGGRRSSGPVGTRSAPDREQNQAIRAWAKSQGLNVSERGRISSEILEAFRKAH